MLVPPVAYQGGKGRLARRIAGFLRAKDAGGRFLDLCCGSGAVSLALVSAGIDPSRIVMVDSGPWAIFWEAVSRGDFDGDRFARLCDRVVPPDPWDIPDFLRALSRVPIGSLAPEIFILLQAGSYGGNPVGIDGDRWKVNGFRSYWVPPVDSWRTTPNLPTMPGVPRIVERIAEIGSAMRGVDARRMRVQDVEVDDSRDVVYFDPPYRGFSGYADDLDVVRIVDKIGAACFVSEARPLSRFAMRLGVPRGQAGVSAKRRRVHDEWLSYFPRDRSRRLSPDAIEPIPMGEDDR